MSVRRCEQNRRNSRETLQIQSYRKPSENDENDDYKNGFEEEETVRQELLRVCHGLRENLIAMLKEERHATRVRDNDEDIKSSSDVKNADYAWSLFSERCRRKLCWKYRDAQITFDSIHCEVKLEKFYHLQRVWAAFDSAPFYELASLLVEDENDYQEEKSSEVSHNCVRLWELLIRFERLHQCDRNMAWFRQKIFLREYSLRSSDLSLNTFRPFRVRLIVN